MFEKRRRQGIEKIQLLEVVAICDHLNLLFSCKLEYKVYRKPKVRITIRLDREVIEWFRARVETQGGGNYQTMINEALRAHIAEREQPLEDILRRVVREEIKRAS